jgi:Kef-type K+ transport system membrane component KefB
MTPARLLWDLFVIFALARLGGEAAVRLGQPSVVGEVLAGAVAGEHALGWVRTTPTLQSVAELGVVFLLFQVGLENRFSELRRVGPTAAGVALWGAAVPFAAGAALLEGLGFARPTALFVGAAIATSSVGATARVLGELGALRERTSQVILGAAVIDDVLGLLLLAAVLGAAQGGIAPARVAVLGAEALFFLVFAALVGTRLAAAHGPKLDALRSADGPFSAAVALCLGLSALAARIGLAAIVGAFQAGMVMAETRERFQLERRVGPVAGLLSPYFFAVSGMGVDLRALRSGRALALLGAVLAVAVAGKLVACSVAARRLGGRAALLVGAGMVPRREVALLVATAGQAAGVLDPELYAIILLVTLVTTVVAPPALRALHR